MNHKRILFEEWALFFIITTTSIISILFFGYMEQSLKLEKLSQRWYSSNSIYFTINNRSEFEIQQVYQLLNDSILFQEIGAAEDIRGVLFQGDISAPEILQGRFFHESDFFVNKNRAVIGKNFISYLYKIGDKQYIEIADKEYEVIGILGLQNNSSLDSMILFNLDSLSETISGVYALDGESKLKVKRSYKDLVEYFNSEYIDHSLILREETGIKRLLDYEKNNIYIYCLTIIIFTLSSISVITSWLEKLKIQIHIEKLVGYKNNIIICEMLKKYLILLHLSYFTAVTVLTILSLNNIISKYFSVLNLYSYLTVILPSTIIVLMLIINHLQRSNIVFDFKRG